ncbi:MAG: hypothetical protein VR69_11620 [Peptococcaceae bacterium BRH_c4b]|nr:MAG: hypothetical protein VR69_11620 [Peptococcaceae bacterium BRH_c4b]
MAVKKSKAVAEETAVQSGKKNKGGASKTLVIVLGAVLIGIAVAGAIFYFVLMPKMTSGAKVAKPPEMEKYDLGERVINLADADGSRFLRVKMVLEYPKNEKLKLEIEEDQPLIQENILHILRTKSVDDIRPVEKEEKVKAEIINVINKDLKSGKVERLYFTDFLIQ